MDMVGSFRSETSSSAMKTSSFPPLDGWNSICGRDHNHIGFHTRQRIFSVVVKFTIDSFFHSISGLHSDAIQCCLLCVWRAYLLLFLVLFFQKNILYRTQAYTRCWMMFYTQIYTILFFYQDQRHFNGIEWPTANTITLALPFECNRERKKATNIFFGIMCARASKLWWRCVFNKYFVDHSSSSCIVLFLCLFVCDEIKSNGTSERGVWLLNGWRDYREKDN